MEDWKDKLDAQQRHERLAGTVRIAIGELCYFAEHNDELAVVERIYGIADMLETELKATDVAYGSSLVASP